MNFIEELPESGIQTLWILEFPLPIECLHPHHPEFCGRSNSARIRSKPLYLCTYALSNLLKRHKPSKALDDYWLVLCTAKWTGHSAICILLPSYRSSLISSGLSGFPPPHSHHRISEANALWLLGESSPNFWICSFYGFQIVKFTKIMRSNDRNFQWSNLEVHRAHRDLQLSKLYHESYRVLPMAIKPHKPKKVVLISRNALLIFLAKLFI